MGACTSDSHHTKSPTICAIPEFHYLCRKTNSLFHCINNKIDSISFKSELSIYSDSIIGLIQTSYIVIIGGTKPSGKQTKKAYVLSIHNKSIYPLPKFPGDFSSGFICCFNNMVYVLSTRSIDLFRYNLASGSWEQPNLSFTDQEDRSLCNYSCYFQLNKIFLICGKYGTAQNTQVFSIDLESLACGKHTEDFPEYIERPVCLGTDQHAIVGGGYTAQGQINTRFFLKTGAGPDWQMMQGPEVEIVEDYPPAFLNNIPIFFSFPKILIKFPLNFIVCNLNTSSLDHTREVKKKETLKESAPVSIKSGESTYEINGMLQERLSFDFCLSPSSPGSVRSSMMVRGDGECKEDAVMRDIDKKTTLSRTLKKDWEKVVPMRSDYRPFLPSNFTNNGGKTGESSDESNSFMFN